MTDYRAYQPCPYCGVARMVASLNPEVNERPCVSCRSSYLLWLIPVGDWVLDAACSQTDPEAFYPNNGEGRGSVLAKKVCAACPVRVKCLQYALDVDEVHGIWGGLTPRERQRLKRKGGSAA